MWLVRECLPILCQTGIFVRHHFLLAEFHCKWVRVCVCVFVFSFFVFDSVIQTHSAPPAHTFHCICISYSLVCGRATCVCVCGAHELQNRVWMHFCWPCTASSVLRTSFACATWYVVYEAIVNYAK